MSPSRSDAWPRSLARSFGRALGRSLRRARGAVACHTIYLHPHGLQAWRHSARDSAEASAAAYLNFDAWCTANAGADAAVYVSGHLLHSLVIDPALGLEGDAAVRSYARQQFAHYHGPQARHWPLAAWCDDFGAVACALHALDMTALRAASAQHDVRLRSVAPAWSAGLNSLTEFKPSFAAPGPRAIALLEGTLLTWLVVDSGCIAVLQQRFLDAPRVTALADLIDRLVGESPALAEAPLVIGWGLDEGETAAPPRCQLLGSLGSLDTSGATMRWMLDTIGAGA